MQSHDRPAGQTVLPRVLVASDVRFLRESVGLALTQSGIFSVVGLCSGSDEALALCRHTDTDIVLLDAATARGEPLVRQLHDLSAGLRVIVFAVSESIDSVLGWADAGVAGYIPSTAALAELHGLLADISAGKQACSAPVAAGMFQRIAANRGGSTGPLAEPPALTRREFEIVQLIGAGLSNKEIARRLEIGLATTKSHVHNALAKLHVKRRGQAATWAHSRSRRPVTSSIASHHLD